MKTFIASRLAATLVILVALTAVMFVLQHISPLDPVKAQMGAQASASAVAARREALGLNDPIVTQFWHYLTGAVQGDLGTSYRTRHAVASDLGSFFPATLELAIYGIGIALVLAVLLAFSTTLKWRGSAVLRAILFTGSSAPMFLLGILGLIVFYQKLGWVPANGRIGISNPPTGPTGLLTVDGLLSGRFDVVTDALHHLILPALVLALGPAVAIGRVLRSSLLTDMDSDYVRTARAKGLSESRIVAGHVLRNCVGSALSMTGLQVGLMFAGVLVVEQVFGWPGIGQYIAQSIPVADFPAIAGVTLMLGALYVFINTVVDLLQAAADPRIAVTGG
ncbi:ABC transporter permease [Mycolicibacterium sp. ELW1]|uniref:Peptide ABC transporter permease n=1 Tax=Mycolicibacterium aichiense TaxID=1799 RepID=A0AAD1HNX2_9MYCO|nr:MULTISPECIES: ABC transporter permease [Mycobacteriaceae]MCV7019491.1 ABC transporter permease [Mycolicibacterium aichiense]QEN14106.1 ABC transporter permease [Mycobacterium sp. ELW1]BBX08199.1 peptide ABC transporter permease [Mycolicibacterium aichiense]STZ82003.1 binding-protein-dependent transport systems inner membrane component [Mycolicibacterium aichiense]